MVLQTRWHGTEEERIVLMTTINRNCTCDPEHGTYTECAPHRMLLTDQRALNGLLWQRRLVERLLREERMVVVAAVEHT
jgi:hypothetical protein